MTSAEGSLNTDCCPKSWHLNHRLWSHVRASWSIHECFSRRDVRLWFSGHQRFAHLGYGRHDTLKPQITVIYRLRILNQLKRYFEILDYEDRPWKFMNSFRNWKVLFLKCFTCLIKMRKQVNIVLICVQFALSAIFFTVLGRLSKNIIGIVCIQCPFEGVIEHKTGPMY